MVSRHLVGKKSKNAINSSIGEGVIHKRRDIATGSGIKRAKKVTSPPAVTITGKDSIDRIAQYLMLCSSKPNSARHPPVSVLLGAGISVAAGIPDLRSCGGMYDTLQPELLTASKEERDIMREDPTFVMSTALFRENQLPLLEFLRPLILNVADHKWQPTLSHRFLELLHEKGLLQQVYTCNIDGLDHQLDLHDKKIVAVHGTAARACCEFCKRDMPSEVFLAFMRSKIKDITASDASAPAQSSEIACPKCRKAGIRPAVVLYGTCLDDKAAQRMELLKTTRLLLVVGTSLTVKPISQLPSLCSQAARVVVNRDPPPHDFAFDSGRDHLLQGDCDDMFAALAARLGWLPELDTRFRDTLPPASLQALNKALEFEAAKLK